jgi:DNA-binding XRE family transcriptional regulator
MEVSRQTINSIETERFTPSLPLAIMLARFFGKPVEAVFQGKGKEAARSKSVGKKEQERH